MAVSFLYICFFSKKKINPENRKLTTENFFVILQKTKRKMRHTLLFITIFFNCFFVNGQKTQNYLKDASVGFVVTDLETEKPLVSQNAETRLAPASVSKLITTATALELLGADFRFETTMQYDGTLFNGILDGNLYICGGGDPTLGSKYFENDFLTEWISMLKINGIKQITGKIIADTQIFDSQALPSGYPLIDIGNWYASGTYALSVFDNIINVYFKSGAAGTKPKITNISPQIANLQIENNLISKKGVGDCAIFSGFPYENKRKVDGSIEANKTDFLVRADMPNPPNVLIDTLTNYLIANGIIVDGKILDTLLYPTKRNLLYVHFSPPLSDIIKNVNHRSNNMFAEHIFKYLSLKNSKQATLAGSIELTKKFWEAKWLNVSTFSITDGCGLSPNSKISAQFINDLLVFMYKKSKNSEVFFESLPIAGQNGTIIKFLKNTVLEGKAHLKSGSISKVQCYAGYIILDTKIYAVTIFVNNFSASRTNVRKEIENMILEAVK